MPGHEETSRAPATSPQADLALLITAARDAGQIARRHFKQDYARWDKAGGAGPVTDADIEIDTMLRRSMRSARPGYGWLSEETPDTPDRLSRARVFIVDPIDGTSAFVAHQTTFAHSLAIAEHGKIIAAVVYLPMEEKLYSAAPGQGAWLNGARLVPAARSGVTGARILAARWNFKPELWPGGMPELDRHFRPSLAWRLCLVADGSYDGMLSLRETWEWDVAAGDLICAEAGIRVTTAAGAQAVYNSASARQPGIIGASGAVHAGLLAGLHP